MIVMKYKKGKKDSGWYSTHWGNDQFVEMESQVIAQMFILQKTNQGYFENLILVFKSKNDKSYWEISDNLKLKDFLNNEYTFGFIKTGDTHEKEVD